MYDYHLHSTNSPDSRMTVDEVCQQAIKVGLKEIAFTDHLDYDCPGEVEFVIDYLRYTREIEDVRKKYHGVLNIVMGLEVGLQPHVMKENEQFVSEHKLDFVIASVHNIDGLGLYNGHFFQEKSRKESYRSYLETLYNMLKSFSHFNVIGHLDAIRRYSGYKDRTMTLKEFPDELDAILHLLVQKGKGIEINSSGFKFGLDDTLPSLEIVKRYRELGGEIVTVGSDAHTVASVGNNLNVAFKVLKSAGFNHVCLFREGNPCNVDLP